MGALIKGDEMRERLQDLLEKTTQVDNEGGLKLSKKRLKDNGKFSYAGSFERS